MGPARLSLNVLLATSALAASLLGVEAVFRALDHDFSGQAKAQLAWPIFYRQPRMPTGEIFFKRAGPDAWTGKVLSTGLELMGGLDAAYPGESVVTIRYGREGFRNPEPLDDWDVVVVGDSFVELGQLPYEQLFTTHLARLLGKRVKNLGVSYTGPLSYLHYLEQYGRAPSTRDAVMVFFEGNDIDDLRMEAATLRAARANGERPRRAIERQTSFLKALWRGVFGRQGSPAAPESLLRNALFETPRGKVPVTISFAPPAPYTLRSADSTALSNAFARWAELARDSGMRPWVVYMPCKHRVLRDHLQFLVRAPSIVDWQPNDLASFVRARAERQGVRFIDVTPALRAEVERGGLPFNTVWDSHLTVGGSLAVARAIAAELAEDAAPPR